MTTTVGPATITINQDHQFVVCQRDATMQASDSVGYFARDTRLVSGYRVTLNGFPPILLDATAVEHFSARHEFISPELPLSGGFLRPDMSSLPARSLGFRLDRTIVEGVHEDYDVTSYARTRVRVTLEVEIDSDFADIFDVRGHRLLLRGSLQSSWDPARAELRNAYRNEGFARELLIRALRSSSPPQFANGRLLFVVEIDPKETWHTCLEWVPVTAGKPGRTLGCNQITGPAGEVETGKLPPVELETSHATLPRIWRQAVDDMEALRMAEFAAGKSIFVPAAGIPWYVTLFGRDSLIVSMESISGFPEFALGALDRLARYQATDDDREQDKEPGKVPHELRFGELAELRLLPFAPYYGTHDATSLFLIVLSYAYQWSGQVRLLERYRGNAEAALRWLVEYGDRDGDGFQEYQSRSSRGLYNQGWKDSGEAIQHADGSIAPVPLALCELQGYAYDALLRMAEMQELWGEPDAAAGLRGRARRLYDRFNDAFWWESEGTYYLGLDGQKRPIESIASNAGHCLASGIVPPERAGRVVDRLMAQDMFSGWGIRTLSRDHPGYNPYSYHCGSVWPHDNATICGGFRRAGRDADAQRVAEAIFAAAERFDSYRLPELYAGLPREPGSFPVPYPGANVPQAWAAASIFRLVAILAGIHTTAATRTIHVNPALPDWLPDLTLRNLRAGKGAAQLRVDASGVEVLENTTGFDIVHGPAPRPEVPPLAPDG